MDALHLETTAEPDFRMEYIREKQAFPPMENHMHDYYEIYYQLTGERYYFIEDRVHLVKAGDLVLINIRDLHRSMGVDSSRYSRLHIRFSRRFLEKIVSSVSDIDPFLCFKENRCHLALSPARQETVVNLLQDMLEESRRMLPGFQTNLRLNLLRLLVLTARTAITEADSTLENGCCVHAADEIGTINEKVSQATQYINSHSDQDISLRELADHFQISYYYFCRMFRQFTGFTLTEYVSLVRIRKAQQLLRETRMSVTEVAGEVGFVSSTSFGRFFKQITRVSPLRYRKQNQAVSK